MVVKYPEVWEKWKEIVIRGKKDPKAVNPEGYLLKSVEHIDYLTKNEGDLEEITFSRVPSINEEDLEEISASAAGAVQGPARKQKKKKQETDNLVNEFYNYLLCKIRG